MESSGWFDSFASFQLSRRQVVKEVVTVLEWQCGRVGGGSMRHYYSHSSGVG